MVVGREVPLENVRLGLESGELYFGRAEQFKYMGTVITDKIGFERKGLLLLRSQASYNQAAF